MKKLFYSVFFIICACSLNVVQATLPLSDFESYETTPYFFRYGNQGNQDMNSYKPRWVYSHEVIDNPYLVGNNSAKVLKYTSMEARNYGLKFRFGVSPTIDEVKSISFKIYQPTNIIGKSVDTQYNSGQQPATVQSIAVKLLSDYNSVCDFRSEDGIVLTAQEFTKEGEWVTYEFTFNKNNYTSSVLGKFNNGVRGIAILPTYNSGVTLSESSSYTCFIDDVDLNNSGLGVSLETQDADDIYYANGNLYIPDMPMPIKTLVYNLSGVLVRELTWTEKISSIPLNLSENELFIVKVQQADGKTFQKVIYPQ